MLFPLSYSETFVLKKEKYHSNAKTLVHSILTGLHKKHVSTVKNVANSIYFENDFNLLDLWGILSPVSSGTILVQEQKAEIYITYKLKFYKLILYPTILAALLLSILLTTGMNYKFLEIAESLLFVWFLLFGGNYVLTIFSFPLFIKRTIKSEI